MLLKYYWSTSSYPEFLGLRKILTFWVFLDIFSSCRHQESQTKAEQVIHFYWVAAGTKLTAVFIILYSCVLKKMSFKTISEYPNNRGLELHCQVSLKLNDTDNDKNCPIACSHFFQVSLQFVTLIVSLTLKFLMYTNWQQIGTGSNQQEQLPQNKGLFCIKAPTHDRQKRIILTDEVSSIIKTRPITALRATHFMFYSLILQNDIHDEIKSRLNSGNACYYSVQNLLSFRLIWKKPKD
jgi:hypothetical protein